MEIYIICNAKITKIEKVEELAQFVNCDVEIEDNLFDAGLVAERQEKERKEKNKNVKVRPAY